METYDTELEARVWERVRGETEEASRRWKLQPLATEELAGSAVYLMLSRQMQGREKALLRQLFEEERAHAECLKGMHWLVTGTPMSLRTVPPAAELPEQALRKCYARTLRQWKAYDSRKEDPEYGPVFRLLAEEEQKHCRMLLELTGSMKR